MSNGSVRGHCLDLSIPVGDCKFEINRAQLCSGLMQREPWDKLGLADDQLEEKSAPIDVHTKEQTGWVAGAKYRQRPSS